MMPIHYQILYWSHTSSLKKTVMFSFSLYVYVSNTIQSSERTTLFSPMLSISSNFRPLETIMSNFRVILIRQLRSVLEWNPLEASAKQLQFWSIFLVENSRRSRLVPEAHYSQRGTGHGLLFTGWPPSGRGSLEHPVLVDSPGSVCIIGITQRHNCSSFWN